MIWDFVLYKLRTSITDFIQNFKLGSFLSGFLFYASILWIAMTLIFSLLYPENELAFKVVLISGMVLVSVCAASLLLMLVTHYYERFSCIKSRLATEWKLFKYMNGGQELPQCYGTGAVSNPENRAINECYSCCLEPACWNAHKKYRTIHDNSTD